jgi:hypothetical protein
VAVIARSLSGAGVVGPALMSLPGDYLDNHVSQLFLVASHPLSLPSPVTR